MTLTVASRRPRRPPSLGCSSTAPASSISTEFLISKPLRSSNKTNWRSPRATSLSTWSTSIEPLAEAGSYVTREKR